MRGSHYRQASFNSQGGDSNSDGVLTQSCFSAMVRDLFVFCVFKEAQPTNQLLVYIFVDRQIQCECRVSLEFQAVAPGVPRLRAYSPADVLALVGMHLLIHALVHPFSEDTSIGCYNRWSKHRPTATQQERPCFLGELCFVSNCLAERAAPTGAGLFRIFCEPWPHTTKQSGAVSHRCHHRCVLEFCCALDSWCCTSKTNNSRRRASCGLRIYHCGV